MEKSKWRKWFEENEQLYFTGEFFETNLKEAQELMPFYLRHVKRGARMLDAGCGPGVEAVPLQKLGFQITGVDFNKEMLEAMKANSAKYAPGVKTAEGDLFNLDELFAPNSFDACISGGVFEHFKLGEIRELLCKQLRVAPLNLFDVPIKSEATLRTIGAPPGTEGAFTDERGIFRNMWTANYWLGTVLKEFNVVESFTRKYSFVDMDALYVAVKR